MKKSLKNRWRGQYLSLKSRTFGGEFETTTERSEWSQQLTVDMQKEAKPHLPICCVIAETLQMVQAQFTAASLSLSLYVTEEVKAATKISKEKAQT